MNDKKAECLRIIQKHNGGCDCFNCKRSRKLLLQFVEELHKRCKVDIALEILKKNVNVKPYKTPLIF